MAYRRAREFVEQYAENLSAGGVFVGQAEGFSVRDQVTIEIDIPGHGVFHVGAEVAHVVPRDDPAGRRCGVGLQLLSPPQAFKDALGAYLYRLGRRTYAKVFVDTDPWRQLIGEAGYRVLPLPPPHQLVNLIGDTAAIGLLAPGEIAEQYRAALSFLGEDGSLVIPIHDALPVEPVLAWLDDKLLAVLVAMRDSDR